MEWSWIDDDDVDGYHTHTHTHRLLIPPTDQPCVSWIIFFLHWNLHLKNFWLQKNKTIPFIINEIEIFGSENSN